jgi:hypothetical protein
MTDYNLQNHKDRITDNHNEKIVHDSQHQIMFGRSACVEIESSTGHRFTVRVCILATGVGNDDLLTVDEWHYETAGWAFKKLNSILENGVHIQTKGARVK